MSESEDNVKRFSGRTTNDIPAAMVLDHVPRADLENVLVIGVLPDGKLYAASTSGDKGVNLWLCERFKLDLLTGEFEE